MRPRSIPLKICLFSIFFSYVPTCLGLAIIRFDEKVYHNILFLLARESLNQLELLTFPCLMIVVELQRFTFSA